MADPLLSIGMFVFGLPQAAYEELSRRAAWRWAESERYGARAASQFVGPGPETLSLEGTLVPELAGSYSDIDRLREMAGSGEVWPVMLGNGTSLGVFRIDAIDDTWRHLVAGGLPRMIQFTIDMTRVDDAA
jgi:phage protein U